MLIKDFIRFLTFNDHPRDQWPLIVGVYLAAFIFAAGLIYALR